MNQTTASTNQLQDSALPNQDIKKSIVKTKSTFRTFKIEFVDALKELKKCLRARIDGNEFSCTKVMNYITGCHFEEVFKIYLKDEIEERHCFTCRETSKCCQRACIKKNNRQFSLDCLYIEDLVDKISDINKPFMKVERINGGCCPGRAIIDVMDGEGDKIGLVKEEIVKDGHIATIYDKRNVMLYEIRSEKPRIVRSRGKNFVYVSCCCGCCGCCGNGKKENEEREFNPKEDNNFKIYDKNHELVAEIKYPCSIEFINVEDPLHKFLIILSRLFMVYFLDKSDTFIEKAYDVAKDRRRDCLSCCCCCCGCC